MPSAEPYARPAPMSSVSCLFEAGLDKMQLGNRVDGLYQSFLDARLGREREWFTNLAFRYGNQDVEWNPARHELKKPRRAPTWYRPQRWNEIAPAIEHYVAIITKDELQWNPVAQDQETMGLDFAKTEAAQQVMPWLWREQDADKYRDAAIELAAICGTSALEEQWDGFAGGFVQLARDPAAATIDAMGVGDRVPVGDHKTILRTPFELLPDPAATGDDDVAALFTLSEAYVPWVIDTFGSDPVYGENARAVMPSDLSATADMGLWFLRQFQEFGRFYGWGGLSAPASRDTCLFKTLYVPACKQRPNGMAIMSVGSKIVYEGDNPVYPFDPSAKRGRERTPVFVHRHRWNGKRWWGEPLVSDLVGPQQTINDLLTQFYSNVRAAANPMKVTHPGVPITDDPCQVIRTQGGNTPPDKMVYVIPPAPVSPATLEGVREARAHLRDRAGISDATQGKPLGPEQAGVALQFASEQDATRLRKPKRDYDKVATRWGRYKLLLCARHWQIPRFVEVAGEDQLPNLVELKGADFSAGTDFYLVGDQGLPHSRKETWALVSQLFNTKPWEAPPEWSQWLFQALRLGGGEALLVKGSEDVTKARRQIVALSKGMQQQAAFFDDHEVIAREITSWMKKPSFEAASARAPAVKFYTEQLLAAHTMALDAKRAQAAQTQAAQAGVQPGGSYADAMGEEPAGAQPAEASPA